MALSAEQLEKRTMCLGGSDAAAAIGLSRWKTPTRLWAEKTGQIEPDDISDKLCVKLGNRLESVVVELFEEETGKKCRRVNETMIHPKYPFLCANIDRRVVGEGAILEVKTASGWKAKEWQGEEIPVEYLLQVMHYLAVSGAPYGFIAVLIGGNQEFKWKRIDRDEDAIKSLIEKEVKFWNDFVVPRVMPTTITRDDGDTLFKLFPQHEDKEIVLSDDIMRTIESRQSMLADFDSLKGQIDKSDNEIKVAMGEALTGIAGPYKVSWKTQSTKRLDTDKLKKENPSVYETYSKTTQSRVFRITEAKQKGDK